jgi:hypothetical protein
VPPRNCRAARRAGYRQCRAYENDFSGHESRFAANGTRIWLPNGQRSPAAAHDRTSGRLVQRVLGLRRPQAVTRGQWNLKGGSC